MNGKYLNQLFHMRVVNIALILTVFLAAIGSLPASIKLSFNPKSVFTCLPFIALVVYLSLGVLLYLVQNFKTFQTSLPLKRKTRLSGDFEIFSFPSQENIRIRSTKNDWGRLGSPLLHLGLLLLIFAGFLTWRYAEIRDIEIAEGETYVFREDLKVKLEKFLVQLHPGTARPEGYTSRLFIQEKKGTYRDELAVNRPLNIGPWKLFQMRYRYEIQAVKIAVLKDDKLFAALQLRPGERKVLDGTRFEAALEDVVPDFAIDRQNQISSRSIYFLNPAARVAFYQNGQLFFERWAFKDLVMPHQKGNGQEWKVLIEKINTKYTSGIKISKDPGAPFAYAGFVLLVLGTFIASFVRPHFFQVSLNYGEQQALSRLGRSGIESQRRRFDAVTHDS